MSHTPTPWTRIGVTIATPDGRYIADVTGAISNKSTVADAEHIVRCVNAHDELVAALRTIESQGGDVVETWAAGIARAALAKVDHA